MPEGDSKAKFINFIVKESMIYATRKGMVEGSP